MRAALYEHDLLTNFMLYKLNYANRYFAITRQGLFSEN